MGTWEFPKLWHDSVRTSLGMKSERMWNASSHLVLTINTWSMKHGRWPGYFAPYQYPSGHGRIFLLTSSLPYHHIMETLPSWWWWIISRKVFILACFPHTIPLTLLHSFSWTSSKSSMECPRAWFWITTLCSLVIFGRLFLAKWNSTTDELSLSFADWRPNRSPQLHYWKVPVCFCP